MNSIITGLLDAGHHVKVLAINSPKYNVKDGDIPEEYRKKTGIELIDVDLDVKPIKAFLNLFRRPSRPASPRCCKKSSSTWCS